MLKVQSDEFLWQGLSHNSISLSGVGDFLFTSPPGLVTDPTDADLSNDSLSFFFFFLPSQTFKNLKLPFRKINFPFIVTRTYSVQSSLCKHTRSFTLAFVNTLGFLAVCWNLAVQFLEEKRKRDSRLFMAWFSEYAEYLLWTVSAVPLKIRSPMWCWREHKYKDRLCFSNTSVYMIWGRK